LPASQVFGVDRLFWAQTPAAAPSASASATDARLISDVLEKCAP
jgi:hypothetical protein